MNLHSLRNQLLRLARLPISPPALYRHHTTWERPPLANGATWQNGRDLLPFLAGLHGSRWQKNIQPEEGVVSKRDCILGFVAPPLAGKTTQREILQEAYEVHVFPTFEALKKHGSPEVVERILAGGLADDKVMIPILVDHLPDESAVLVDSPRSYGQLEAMVELAPQAHLVVVEFVIPERWLFVRREKRVQQYIERGVAPRSDDTVEVLANRLEQYENQVKEMRPAERKLGISWVQVNAHQKTEEVTRELFTRLATVGIRLPSLRIRAS